jgi:transcriptional regulator with XRE-family HTH domain
MAQTARGMHKTVHSPEQLAFRQLLINARKKADLTQQQLSKKLRKPQSFVAKYEGGERRLDVIEFLEICRAVGTDPMRILHALLRILS